MYCCFSLFVLFSLFYIKLFFMYYDSPFLLLPTKKINMCFCVLFIFVKNNKQVLKNQNT